MFVRVKRQKTTIFLMVEPSDSVLEVKSKLQGKVERDIADMKLVHMSSKLDMDDADTLSGLKVENDDVLCLCYRNTPADDGVTAWEDVNIEEHPSAGASGAA